MIRLATVQFTPVYGDRQANITAIAELLDPVDTDIIMFPELCTSGYFFLSEEELAPLAEEVGGPACRFFAELADAKRAVIIAGLAEVSGGAFFDSVFVFRPGVSEPVVYRKSHLFYREQDIFARGDGGFPVIRDERLDVSIGIMLCYEWRFPEASRALALDGADLIVCPSNLVTDLWRKVMPARAIENRVYVAVANRAGSETNGGETLHFTGCSAVYDPSGELLVQAASSGDAVLLTEIDPQRCRDKRINAVNDLFADRRPELYGAICRPR